MPDVNWTNQVVQIQNFPMDYFSSLSFKFIVPDICFIVFLYDILDVFISHIIARKLWNSFLVINGDILIYIQTLTLTSQIGIVMSPGQKLLEFYILNPPPPPTAIMLRRLNVNLTGMLNVSIKLIDPQNSEFDVNLSFSSYFPPTSTLTPQCLFLDSKFDWHCSTSV